MAGRTKLVDEIVQLVYFMRGAIQYHDMYETTYHERQRIGKFIEERLKDEGAKPPQFNRVY